MMDMILFGLVVCSFASIALGQTAEEYAIVQRMLTPSNYDKKVRPGVSQGKSTQVFISVYVDDVSAVDEINMDYELDMYFRQKWKDDRITSPLMTKKINLGYHFLDQVWQPDIYFTNEKTAQLHTSTVPNVQLTLDTDGTLFYSHRLTLKLKCVLDLKRYPFDNQTCELFMMSYGHTIKEIDLQWLSEHAVENGTLSLPEFKFTNVDLKNCTTSFSTGTYSCLAVVFSLQREVGHHITQTYIPSMLIVVLSWVAFYIDYNSVPARISIGLLTVLTITTQSSAIVARLPRVSYTKAIDVWMSTCLVFVFLAFVEFSLVNILARQKPKAVDPNSPAKKMKEGTSDVEDLKNGQAEQPKAVWTKEGCIFRIIPRTYRNQPAGLLDVISRIFFPTTFILFNIVYWAVYYK